MRSRTLARGRDWSARDILCRAGPRDRPFEEQHDAMSVALVTEGTFQYRSKTGAALLAPGALLLGNAGDCFVCGHEHAVGDRCLAFNFAPDLIEETAASIRGVRRARFCVPALPPLPQTQSLAAQAEAARDADTPEALEALGLDLLAGTLAAQSAVPAASFVPSDRDLRRVTAIMRRIEAEADTPVALAALAADAGLSRFHFLRVFRRIVGMPPYQYLLRLRLHRAAVRLRTSIAPVLEIALGAGFDDLSTFNRRFRRLMGTTPTGFRSGAGRLRTRR